MNKGLVDIEKGLRIKERVENRPGKLTFRQAVVLAQLQNFILVRETHSQVAIGLVKKCKNGNMLQLAWQCLSILLCNNFPMCEVISSNTD